MHVYKFHCMRILIIAAVLLATFTVRAASHDPLDSLLQSRQYFQLRDALLDTRQWNLPASRTLFYEAIVDNFFHDCAMSNKKIDKLWKKYRKDFTQKELIILLGKKIDNHVKLYEYQQASETSELVLSAYNKALSDAERKDISNSAIIWKGLIHTAAQQTSITQDSRIPYKRDMAGLINVPVQFADSTFDFVFDTGANLSVITESYAKKAGLDILNVPFDVRAVTGIEVKAQLGIARELRVGDIVVKNVVFIVFPDSALSFGGGVYQIRGIIGFPVIEQLAEVHIDKAGFIKVPKLPANKPIHNFGLDELTPVINIRTNNDMLAFTFDTGAQQTDLYYSYYTRYKTVVELTGTPIDMKQGGAGGVSSYKAFKLPATMFSVGGKDLALKNLGVKTTHGDSKDKFYYGNLGQDMMSQFSQLVINFKYMYVDFVP